MQNESTDHGSELINPEIAIDDFENRLQQKSEFARSLSGVTVELCGAWLWVSGDTYPHREALKEQGFRFSHKKRMWYFAGVPARPLWARSQKEFSMPQIRETFGSEFIAQSLTPKLS
jgi:hypothetical protein